MDKFVEPSVPENRNGLFWWLSPQGKFYSVQHETHGNWARNYLINDMGKSPEEVDSWQKYREMGDPEKYNAPYYVLIGMGWLRIGIYEDWLGDEKVKFIEYDGKRGEEPSLLQLRKIREMGIEKGAKYMKNDRTKKETRIDEIIRKSDLKVLIKAILKETVNRMGTTGVFVEPNGTVHDVESESHWSWADAYLSNLEKRFSDDPIEELIRRGWMRVIFSPNESLIMVMTGSRRNSYLTRQQKEYLEDQSEETSWSVKDDDGYVIYTPIDCVTPEEFLREDYALGTSHGAIMDDPPAKVRDPLNDPRLNQKLAESFRFHDYNWLGNMAGFNKPTDVYNGAVYLGIIESRPDGYVILAVAGPHHIIEIKQGGHNKFKNKNQAAETLRRTWQYIRSNKPL